MIIKNQNTDNWLSMRWKENRRNSKMVHLLIYLFPKTTRRIWNEGFKQGLVSNQAYKLPLGEFEKYLNYIKSLDKDPLKNIE